MRERDILHVLPLAVGVWNRIMRQQSAAETFHDSRHDGAYLARADDAYSPAVQIETQQPVEGEIAFAHAGVGAVYLAVERQDQTRRMLGHRIRRVSRDADHGQP